LHVYERVRALVNTGQLQPDLLQEVFNLNEAASRLDKVIVQALGAAQYARSGGIDLSADVDTACDHALAALRTVRDQARILTIRHKL
ncbi:MAG TPA: hypothetical protein VHB98_15255, partial [Chloroflexota bacterium]|nr:hypothetical protein [Chloroflexota bacterium]